MTCVTKKIGVSLGLVLCQTQKKEHESIESYTQHRFEQVVEGCKPVHPGAPELGQLLWWHNNTTETHDEQEENRHEQTGQ